MNNEIPEPKWNRGNQVDGLVFIAQAVIYLARVVGHEINDLKRTLRK